MTSKIKSILNLLRIRQYYKNVLIFVGIFFSGRLFEFDLYFQLIIGFILLCCASSINYIINDIMDIEKDKRHIEKMRKKPLASGELSVSFAIILLIILGSILLFSLIIIIPNWGFIGMIILIIATGQSYNYLFKNFPFIDLLILSMGYVWRSLAGCTIIEEYVSAWLVLAIFEIAMFLSITKRKGDLEYLGKENASRHKKVYDQYSSKLLDQFQIIIVGSLFITYSLYLIQKFDLYIPSSAKFYEFLAILTIPLFLYILMRYMYLTSAESRIARNPEKAFFDLGILIAALILVAILFFSFYF